MHEREPESGAEAGREGERERESGRERLIYEAEVVARLRH